MPFSHVHVVFENILPSADLQLCHILKMLIWLTDLTVLWVIFTPQNGFLYTSFEWFLIILSYLCRGFFANTLPLIAAPVVILVWHLKGSEYLDHQLFLIIIFTYVLIFWPYFDEVWFPFDTTVLFSGSVLKNYHHCDLMFWKIQLKVEKMGWVLYKSSELWVDCQKESLLCCRGSWGSGLGCR